MGILVEVFGVTGDELASDSLRGLQVDEVHWSSVRVLCERFQFVVRGTDLVSG